MAEGNDMGAERPIPERTVITPKPIEIGGKLNGNPVPKIEIENPETLDYGTDTGMSFERMLELDGIKDQIGEFEPNKNWKPQLPNVPKITYDKISLTGEQLEKWRKTPLILEDGTSVGTVQDHLGDHSMVPHDPHIFKARVALLFRNALDIIPSQDEVIRIISGANRLIHRYKNADKGTQSKMTDDVEASIFHLKSGKPQAVRVETISGKKR